MRCHYDVLALERDAAASDIKKAFHRQALKWHPDKHQRNDISSDEATQRFQEIQNAYEVLSDPHERKWYDDHRDQILRGDDGTGGDGENENDLNLFRYFSASVYSGFGDDDKSFYSVYEALFEKIDALDVESAGASAHAAPVLGDSTTPMDDVNAFYRHWMSYISQRSFAWVDEYKTTDAPTRQIRRAMEKENKKLRDVAKKAFTTDVRALVDFVRKRDPRMVAFQKQKDKDRQLQLERDEQKKREKQAAYEAQRQAFQQQERDRWENGHEQQQPTSRVAEDDIQAELDRLRKKLDAELLLCELCNKTFKSDKQLHNHFTSKKHKDRELELGIVSEFDSVEEALDQELQAELAELKRAKQQAAEEEQAKARKEQAPAEENGADASPVDDAAEAAEAARREKERVRLEKEEKAAEKRRERKDARKSKKKEEVEKIVSAAKKKEAVADADEEDGRRGKGSRGKKKR